MSAPMCRSRPIGLREGSSASDALLTIRRNRRSRSPRSDREAGVCAPDLPSVPALLSSVLLPRPPTPAGRFPPARLCGTGINPGVSCVAPVQVLVSMRAPGLAPEELESRVTTPVEIAVRGVPNLVSMRSTTRYSLALITFEFAEGTDIYWARAQVNERLQEVRDLLPDGTEGGLAPIVTPLAEMLMFTVESPSLSVQEIRSLIDWTIRPRLRGLPGVADVNVLGGLRPDLRSGSVGD